MNVLASGKQKKNTHAPFANVQLHALPCTKAQLCLYIFCRGVTMKDNHGAVLDTEIMPLLLQLTQYCSKKLV